MAAASSRIALACAVLLCAGPAPADEPAPAPPPSAAPVRVVTEPPPRPLAKKPIFWVTLFGGLALVATGVTLGVIYGSVERDPIATIGIGIGN
ncbi:MAG TPA: hypothetical protein VMZ28_22990 [Kofleriaceae bacterium]|nr:hypothetical protein [Kofleriaceae bacterium]